MKKKNLQVILILISLFVRYTDAYTQYIEKPIKISPFYYHLGDEEGLPNQEIYDIYEDKKGYLWLGTAKGLVKYDGRHFQLFENKESESGKGSGIYQLQGDEIYYPNFEGDLLICKDNELKTYVNNTEKGNQLNSLYAKTDNGYLYILKNHVLFIKNINTNEIKNVSLKKFIPEINDKTIIQIICVSDNEIFITVNNKQLIKVLKDKISISVPEKILNPKVIFSTSRFGYIKDTLWIANRFSGDLHYFTRGQFYFKKNLFSDIPFQITIIGEGPDKSVWIGTLNGAFPLYQNEYGNLLTGKAISKFKIDSDNNWFIGTLQEGIFVFPFRNSWIVETDNQKDFQKSISILSKDEKGNLLAASINGDAFIQNLNKFKYYLAPGHPEVTSILTYNSKNELYLGGTRLFKFDLTTGKLIDNKVMGSIKSIAKLDDEHIVAGSSSGLLLYSNLKNKGKKDSVFDYIQQRSILIDSTLIKIIKEPFAKIREGRCQYVFIDSKKYIWSYFQDGLYYSDLYNFKKLENSFTSKPINVSEITETDDGKVYVATKNQGILVYKDGKLINQINTLNNIDIKYVSTISSFKNTIVFASNSGLFEIEPDGKVKFMNSRNGLCSDQIFSLKTDGKDIYTATPRGLFKYPFDFNENIKKVSLHITKLTVNNRKINISNNQMIFSNDSKIFEFEFDGLGYFQKKALNYQVLLEGLEQDWRNIENINTTIYSSLSYGDYCFKCRIVDAFGNPISNEVRIYFKIEKPFYLSIWFYIIIFLSMVGTVFGIVKYWISTTARSAQIAALGTSLKYSQLSALVAQMNPHFLFNSLNTIQHAVQVNQKEKAVQLLQKFSKMMRQILDMSNKQNISILNEFQSLELFLEIEKARFEDQLHYKIEMDEQIDPEIKIPTLIIQPFVENAIKHGIRHKMDGGLVHIIFKKVSQNCIEVFIEDNGVGRSLSQKLNQEMGRKHNSFAMGAIEKRIALLNEGKTDRIELKIVDKLNKDGEPEGTLVKIRIPIYE